MDARSWPQGAKMTFDQWLKVAELLKWPLVVLIVIGVCLWLYYKQVGALLAGFSSRKFRFGGAEVLPEQLDPAPQPAPSSPAVSPVVVNVTVPVVRAGPHLFEVDDSAFFRQRVDALQQWLATLHFNNAEERERFLLRQGAALFLRVDFEQLYREVWGSQMDLLAEANRPTRGVTRAQARAAYDHAAAKSPEVYKTYPFERWIEFLTLNELLRATETGFIATEKAKAFIQYLVFMSYELRGRYPIL